MVIKLKMKNYCVFNFKRLMVQLDHKPFFIYPSSPSIVRYRVA